MAVPPLPLRFDPFTLELDNERLLRHGHPVPLTPKAFALLAFLVQRAGKLVLKDELLDGVWGRRFVSEGTLKSLLAELRSAMGDDARAPRWVETVPRRGLRFIGRLESAPGGASVAGAEAARPPSAAPMPPGMPVARSDAPSQAPSHASSHASSHGPPRASTQASTAGSPHAPAGAPPLHAPGSAPAAAAAAGLPLPATSPPIARETELADLLALLHSQRLVTLIGPAGVGKTCLALAAGTAWGNGQAVWWVELAPLARADADGPALRAMLVSALRLAPGAGASDDALAAALAASSGLLLLDNAEHVLDALAPLVARLHRSAPSLRWLLTSREPLKVAGEQLFRLNPLPVPVPADDADLRRVLGSGAVRLFVASVAARLPGFALTESQAAAAARVCRSLDGLPLALEMAAARVPVLGVGGLAEQLGLGRDDGSAPEPEPPDPGAAEGGRLALLTHGWRDRAPHQRTLRASLTWSHAMLAEDEQRVFRRLAVFRGGFTLPATSAVCADLLGPAEVLEALQALVEKSLVHPSAGIPYGGGPPRFTLLESIREFAAEQLKASAEADIAARAHLQAVGDHWRRADAEALDVPAMDWLDRHGVELDNTRAALRWARRTALAGPAAERGAVALALLALIGHTHLLWTRHGLPQEGRQQCEVADEVIATLADPPPEALRANIDLLRADLAFIYRVLPIADGLAAAERACTAHARGGDPHHEFHARGLAASLLLESGRAAEGDGHIERMRALARPHWSPLRLRYLRVHEATRARRLGDLATFGDIAREQWRLMRRLQAAGESWTAAHLVCLAEGLQGRAEEALSVTGLAAAEILAAGRLQQFGQLLSMHAMLSAEHRTPAEARQVLQHTLPLLPQMGAAEVQWLALAWLAWNEQRTNDAARVVGWFESPSHGAAARFGPETLVGQTRLRLVRRLEEAQGAAATEALRREGHALGMDQALQVGLAEPPPP